MSNSKPRISIIVAMANNRVIGKNNDMPWHLPSDLKHFKTVTLGKPIIMGRKTYESIGRPLPGRKNIVISRNKDYILEGCETATSLEEAIKLVNYEEEIFIIGGGNLYKQAINSADMLYLTFIDLEVDGDTFFPDYTLLNIQELKRDKFLKDEKNPYNYEFVDYKVEKLSK
jgi:dihydrofolate reductase